MLKFLRYFIYAGVLLFAISGISIFYQLLTLNPAPPSFIERLDKYAQHLESVTFPNLTVEKYKESLQGYGNFTIRDGPHSSDAPTISESIELKLTPDFILTGHLNYLKSNHKIISLNWYVQIFHEKNTPINSTDPRISQANDFLLFLVQYTNKNPTEKKYYDTLLSEINTPNPKQSYYTSIDDLSYSLTYSNHQVPDGRYIYLKTLSIRSPFY